MNEAELAQVLGEAMRQKSHEIRAGIGLQPFKNLLNGGVATITVHLSGDGQLTFGTPIPTLAAKSEPEPKTIETPKPRIIKSKEKTTTSENSYS